MRNFLTLFGALLATFSTLPYLVDIYKKKTKPNIVSWLTWTLLTTIATAAAFAAHEPRTALLTLGSTLCSAFVVILGLRYGIAKFNRFDIFCQIGAVLGLVLWLIFNSPTIGIVVPVIIDFVAVLPTLHHAWLKPGEETWQTFVIGFVASSAVVLSLPHITLNGLLYPVYLVAANIVITSTILYRRRVVGLAMSR